MNENKKPIEKYVSICKECEDTEKRKNRVNEVLLKDEMLSIAERNGLDVNKSSTKDEIAEKLVKPEVYEDIIKEKDESVKEKEHGYRGLERSRPEFLDADILSPFREMFPGSITAGSKKINELWMDGIKEVEDNLEKITNNQIEYWDNIEEEWTKRASEFQEQIEELRENSELPAEEVKELAVIWRNFCNKMSARMTKLAELTKERQESLNKITEKHRTRASKTFTEESDVSDIGKLFALWSDFSEDMRKEMGAAMADYDMDYGDYTETWERFSEKTEDLLNGFQKNQATQAERLYKQWSSNFKHMRYHIEKGYSEYENVYNIFWNGIEEQSSKMTEIASEIAEEMEENYSNILESYVETVNRGYDTLFNMPGLSTHIPKQEKKLDDLKKRVKVLEEQIEGD